jgi:ABC-2 type transport system ATP-binding protein
MKLVGLAEVADKKVSGYSGGMKRRLDLASALVHKPKLLFLDEPTIGLDPQSRAAIWRYLEELNKTQGVTIFLTTQYLDEADKLCKRLSIIDNGQIVISGTPTELKQQIGGDTITVKLVNQNGNGNPLEAKKVAESVQGISKVIMTADVLTAVARDAGEKIPELIRAFDTNKIPVASVTFASPSLDDVFLQHTGRRIRPEELQKKPVYAFTKAAPRRQKIPFH